MNIPRLLTTALAAAAIALPAQADFTLTILHTNDFHSRIEPVNKYNSGCGAEDAAEGKCFGGSARLVTAIRARRAAAEHSILVDGGDQFQGTLFYTQYQGQAEAGPQPSAQDRRPAPPAVPSAIRRSQEGSCRPRHNSGPHRDAPAR